MNVEMDFESGLYSMNNNNINNNIDNNKYNPLRLLI